MGVDWTIPQPTYEALHAQLDALQTERNAAVAEAKLWQRRLLTMQEERDRANATVREAEKFIEGWQTAYMALLREYWKICGECTDAQWWRDHHADMRQIDKLPTEGG